MIRLVLSASIAALAAGAIVEPAAAQAPRVRAEQFFRAGEQAYRAGRFDLAAQAFEQAYSVLPLPAIAFSAAQAYRLQYFIDKDPPKLKRAVVLYRRYLDDVPSGGRREDAAASLAELDPLLTVIEADNARLGLPPVAAIGAGLTTKLMVTSSTRGARASIDGGPAAPLPIVRDIEPGRYRIRVSAPGHRPYQGERDVVEGQFRVVEIELDPEPALVAVRSRAGAGISIDGRLVGTAPLQRPLALASGSHSVHVALRGHRPWSREVRLGRGERAQLTAELEPTGQRRTAVWILGGSAALVVGSGIAAGLSIAAGSRASDINQEREGQGIDRARLADYERAVDRRDDRAKLAWALLGAGGALAIGGGLLYYLDNPSATEGRLAPTGSARPADLRVLPAVGPGSAGFALDGRF